ncbi:MAG: hypothetical protein QM679_11205 [Patulibacter sp.]
MTGAKGFRGEMERWWDDLIAQGRRDKNPYVPDLALKDRVRSLAPDDPERALIDEVLLGWLLSEDDLRWQPALADLTIRRVRSAVPVIRVAAEIATTEVKQSFADVFIEKADKIEAFWQGESP